MRRISTLLLLGLLLPLARAGVPPLSLQQLCQHSTRILRGQVVQSRVHWKGSMIVTDWTIRPARNLKGQGTKELLVSVPGGQIGVLRMHASAAPHFRLGEDVILFLRPGVSPCDVYGWFRGKYTVVGGKIREKPGLSATRFLAQITSILRKLEKK